MPLPRASGILLHPTSLPGPFGIGDLGPAAARFVEFLAATGQRWWQVLPLGPTGYGNSPYQAHSSFAGNRLLISPERLTEHGLLTPTDWNDLPSFSEHEVDFDLVASCKDHLLRLAFTRFHGGDDFDRFVSEQAAWLDDYALYSAVKEVHGGRSWNDWDPAIAARRPDAVAHWQYELREPVRYHKFLQYLFATQWATLRRFCRDRSVHLIGDLPIFVAQDSADVWSRPDLFQLDDHGRATVVAGVPPDYFSEDGQLWGNPLYRWDAHRAEGYAWWIARLRAACNLVDLVRLDHFRGFQAYWEIPAGSRTAKPGKWQPGPGAPFLHRLRDALGHLPLIAEDLGVITPPVEALRDEFELPGMRVLQFAFGDDSKANDYLPCRYIRHCVVYTGTHDNDTTVGWFTGSGGHTTQSSAVKAAEQAFVLSYTGSSGTEIHWDLIRLALGSVADTAIIPLQDILGLGSEARMNIPGVPGGNWRWRLRADLLGDSVRDRLAELTAVYFRWNGEIPTALRVRRTQAKPA